jgi:hypothetical protein
MNHGLEPDETVMYTRLLGVTPPPGLGVSVTRNKDVKVPSILRTISESRTEALRHFIPFLRPTNQRFWELPRQMVYYNPVVDSVVIEMRLIDYSTTDGVEKAALRNVASCKVRFLKSRPHAR